VALVLVFASKAWSASGASAGVGNWIWDATVLDRQECRFVREFEIPEGAVVEAARLRITADNSYQLFLDGQPIGRGGDWRVLIEYDLTRLLSAGSHVLAVAVVNDFDVAGLVAGLRVTLRGGAVIELDSDPSWLVMNTDARGWPDPARPFRGRPSVVVDAFIDRSWKPAVYYAPVSEPMRITIWERRWFQVSLLAAGAAGLAGVFVLSSRLVLKSQAERVVRRERARIAADLHDNLGGGLTQLVMLGEGLRRDAVGGATGDDKPERVCEQARELAREMNETVWLINSERDTVRDLASYVTRYAEAFFQDTAVRCRFEIDAALPELPCDLGVRRNLFLAVKEVLNNILRHSGADLAEVSIQWTREELRIAIRDNGCGFDPGATHAGNGLRNLALRAREAGGSFVVESRPGEGSRFEFRTPVAVRSRWRRVRPWRGRSVRGS
jgi:signal transduction histidine kinase